MKKNMLYNEKQRKKIQNRNNTFYYSSMHAIKIVAFDKKYCFSPSKHRILLSKGYSYMCTMYNIYESNKVASVSYIQTSKKQSNKFLYSSIQRNTLK